MNVVELFESKNYRKLVESMSLDGAQLKQLISDSPELIPDILKVFLCMNSENIFMQHFSLYRKLEKLNNSTC